MKKNNNGLITDFFYTIITGIVVVAFINGLKEQNYDRK